MPGPGHHALWPTHRRWHYPSLTALVSPGPVPGWSGQGRQLVVFPPLWLQGQRGQPRAEVHSPRTTVLVQIFHPYCSFFPVLWLSLKVTEKEPEAHALAPPSLPAAEVLATLPPRGSSRKRCQAQAFLAPKQSPKARTGFQSAGENWVWTTGHLRGAPTQLPQCHTARGSDKGPS